MTTSVCYADDIDLVPHVDNFTAERSSAFAKIIIKKTRKNSTEGIAVVCHDQQPGYTSLQTINLRHPCLQCRWSSLLECFTGSS